MQIPQSLYDYYKEIPRPPTENYSVYVTHPWDDNYIDQLVDGIQKHARQEGFNEVDFAAAFVQSLPYTPDSVSTPYDEYPRYPIETLDNGGDCEDTSILMASLLNRMGYGVVIIFFPGEHSAVGVLGGEEYKDLKARVFDMVSSPVLYHSWSATQRVKAEQPALFDF